MNVQSPLSNKRPATAGPKRRLVGLLAAAFISSLIFTFPASPAATQIEIVQNRQTSAAQGRGGRNQQSRGGRGGDGGQVGVGGERRVRGGGADAELERIRRLERQINEQRNRQDAEGGALRQAQEAVLRARQEAMLRDQAMAVQNRLRSGGGFPGGAARPGVPGLTAASKGPAKFTLPQAPILLKVEPSLLLIKPGGDFSSKVMLANFSGQELDEIRFVLRFDPRLLQVQETEVASEEDEAVANVQVRWDNELGRLEFLEHYTAPQNMSDWLLTVHWLPVSEAGTARIEFERLPESTSLRLAGRELTSFGPNAANWLLSSIARLIGERGLSKPTVINDADRFLTAASMRNPLNGGMLRALLNPQSAPPAPGKIWTVDIILDNPGGDRISDIEFELLFNPAKLALIDYDRDNFIRRGVNVWDGFARDSFPFDRHIANRQDRAGRLIYHMGFWQPRVCSSAPFARLHLMVLQPVSAGDLQIAQCKIK